MAKKKNKPQVINNIQELKPEIDSDKLEELIVRAILKAQNVSTIQEDDPNDEETFVDKAVSGKIPEGKLFSKSLSKLMEWFFYMLAIASIVLVLYFCLLTYEYITPFSLNVKNIIFIVLAISLALFDAFFVIIIWRIGYEIGVEQDKNYIVSAFSCVVSLAALIVALVALFKGVG